MYQLIFSDSLIVLADEIVSQNATPRGTEYTFKITDAYSLKTLQDVARGHPSLRLMMNRSAFAGDSRDDTAVADRSQISVGMLFVSEEARMQVRNSAERPMYFFDPVRAKWAAANKISDFQAAEMVDMGLLVLDEKGCKPAPGTEEYALKAVRAYAGLMNHENKKR
jgi:hypothetical protein